MYQAYFFFITLAQLHRYGANNTEKKKKKEIWYQYDDGAGGSIEWPFLASFSSWKTTWYPSFSGSSIAPCNIVLWVFVLVQRIFLPRMICSKPPCGKQLDACCYKHKIFTYCVNIANFDKVRLKCENVWVWQRKWIWCTLPIDSCAGSDEASSLIHKECKF